MIPFKDFMLECPARDWYENPKTTFQEGDFCTLYANERQCKEGYCPTYYAIKELLIPRLKLNQEEEK